ncbi:MAG: BolA family transcriptional regulator [Alphaproteobacteria bacterium]|nr:BolA family transcriptional regulator [Alphaproteobacteria bacterium]MBV8549189.1 BolA family transcriptional regulator [Alphaproteobacteria bacterium]
MKSPTYAQRIEQKLTAALAPSLLIVEDQSARHSGHSGSRPEGETHFAVTIVSAQFIGKSRIEQHRMIHNILAEELNEHVHALALTCRLP